MEEQRTDGEESEEELEMIEGENSVELCANSDPYYGPQLERSPTN